MVVRGSVTLCHKYHQVSSQKAGGGSPRGWNKIQNPTDEITPPACYFNHQTLFPTIIAKIILIVDYPFLLLLITIRVTIPVLVRQTVHLESPADKLSGRKITGIETGE